VVWKRREGRGVKIPKKIKKPESSSIRRGEGYSQSPPNQKSRPIFKGSPENHRKGKRTNERNTRGRRLQTIQVGFYYRTGGGRPGLVRKRRGGEKLKKN